MWKVSTQLPSRDLKERVSIPLERDAHHAPITNEGSKIIVPAKEVRLHETSADTVRGFVS